MSIVPDHGYYFSLGSDLYKAQSLLQNPCSSKAKNLEICPGTTLVIQYKSDHIGVTTFYKRGAASHSFVCFGW